ncbi:hypothetical protein CSV68_12545 [Sporosarcina sp. P29]|nr:hypothetical protein CSV68_12545 [Sporosarcina sp. P29]
MWILSREAGVAVGVGDLHSGGDALLRARGELILWESPLLRVNPYNVSEWQLVQFIISWLGC